MKTDGGLARCVLKGTLGDAVFAVFRSCGHDIGKILAPLRALLRVIAAMMLAIIKSPRDRHIACSAACSRVQTETPGENRRLSQIAAPRGGRVATGGSLRTARRDRSVW